MDGGVARESQGTDVFFGAITGDVYRVIFAIEIFPRRPLLCHEVGDVVGDIEFVAGCLRVFGGEDFRRLFQRFQPTQGGGALGADTSTVQTGGGVGERLEEAQGRRRPFRAAVVAAPVKRAVEETDADAEEVGHGGLGGGRAGFGSLLIFRCFAGDIGACRVCCAFPFTGFLPRFFRRFSSEVGFSNSAIKMHRL